MVTRKYTKSKAFSKKKILCVFINNLKYLPIKFSNRYFFYITFIQHFLFKNFQNHFMFFGLSYLNINTKLQIIVKLFKIFKLYFQSFNNCEQKFFSNNKTPLFYLLNHSFFFKNNLHLTRDIANENKKLDLQTSTPKNLRNFVMSKSLITGKAHLLLTNFAANTCYFKTLRHEDRKLKKSKKENFFAFFTYEQASLYKLFSRLSRFEHKKKNYFDFFNIIKILNFSKTYLSYFRTTILLFKKLFKLYRKNKRAKFSKFIITLRDIFHRNIIVSRSNFNFNNFEILIRDDTIDSNPVLKSSLNLFNLFKSSRMPLRKKKKSRKSLFVFKKKTFKFRKKNLPSSALPNNTILSFFFNLNFFKFFIYFFFKTTSFSLDLILNKFNLFQKQFSLYSGCHFFFNTNFNKNTSFKFLLKKKIMKVLSYQKFNQLTSLWHDNALTKFIEHCSGKKALVRFFFFIENTLTAGECARCLLWSHRLQNFQRTIGTGFFLTESIQIIYIAIKLKDPYFLINWMRQTFQKISFWKYRMFFHYLKYLFKYFFSSIFSELKVKGLKFKLKGKVSVAGNSRTRTVVYQVGHVSHSTYDNKILHSFDLVRTFTGVIGLQIWMVF